jgi:DNA polymerase/3'-5' exonuclease PolX
MRLERAEMLACAIMGKLRMHCDRIAIAGSIRRRKPEVGDIEIVCIPRLVAHFDLLGEQTASRDTKWAQAVRALGDVIKGDPDTGKYVQVELQDEQHGGIAIDIFTANLSNWGLIYAIRTGSARYSHEVLARGWVAAGYHSVDGFLVRNGVEYPTPEEENVFKLAGVPWCEPQLREVQP